MPGTPPPGSLRRTTPRPAPRAGSPFTPRRPPGSRRSRGGLTLEQRARRNRWGLVALVVLLVVVVGRLALVQGVDGAAYANAAQQDRLRTYPIAALRGSILDRDGNPLAYTVDASRVVADPTVVKNPEKTARELSPLVGVPVADLTEKLEQDTRYVVLAPQVTPQTVDLIDALGLGGISFEDAPQRLYPAGSVGGQVVGFVNRSGTGAAGVEQRYQDQLAGTDGQRRVEVGSGGNPIPSGIDESTPAVDGDTITLTVDEDLQYVAEQRLAQACSDGATTRASAVVLDVHTGQVMAMASCPGYDPAHYNRTDPDLLGNPAVSDVFEPGSVMKAVTMSAALQEGVATPSTVLSVPGPIQAGAAAATTAPDHDPADWRVTGFPAKSGNAGS